MAAFDPWSIFRPYMGGGETTTPGTAAAGGPTLTGAAPAIGAGAYGAVPQVPSPQATQTAAITGNTAALPGIQTLAGQVNPFQLEQITKQYQAGIPGYTGLAAKSAANIGQSLAGELPQDVITQMQQAAAERGIATGTSGSPNANAAYLRALGLTSLGQQRYGEQALTGAVARMPRAPIMDLASYMVTPAQQQQAQEMANLLAAAPDPTAAAAANLNLAAMGRQQGYSGSRTTTPMGTGMGTSGQDILAGVQAIMDKYNRAMPTTPATPSLDQAARTPGWGTTSSKPGDLPQVDTGANYMLNYYGVPIGEDYVVEPTDYVTSPDVGARGWEYNPDAAFYPYPSYPQDMEAYNAGMTPDEWDWYYGGI